MKTKYALILIYSISFGANTQADNAQVTRSYSFSPSILDVIILRDASTTNEFSTREMGSAKQDVNTSIREFFVKAGVPFPAGSSIIYNSLTGELVMVNTEENQAILDAVLSATGAISTQVEVVISLLRTIGPTDAILQQETLFNPHQLTTLSSNRYAILDSISGISCNGVNAETMNGQTTLSFNPYIGPDGKTVTINLKWYFQSTNDLKRSISTSVMLQDRHTIVLQAKRSGESLELVTLTMNVMKTDGKPLRKTTQAK